MTWLSQLLPFITPEQEFFIFVNVFPPVLLLFLFVLFFIIIFMPGSGWTRFKAKLKRTGVLVSLCGDDGFERDVIMKASMGHGIFSKGDSTYVFTPDPKYHEEEVEEKNPDGTTKLVKKNMLEITTDQKKIIDEAIQKRMFTDTGKPHYVGLVSKGVAVTPELLALIQNVNKNAKENKINQIDLIEPQILKTYIRKTFSETLIDSLTFAAERKGYLRRPVQDFISKNKIPIGLLLICGLIAILILTGQIDISGLLGG